MKRLSKLALITIIAWVLAIGGALPGAAVAGIVGTDEVLSHGQAELDRERIQAELEREDVRDALTGYGVDPADVEDRLAALSDQEVREMAEQMEQQPAGAGVSIGATTILLLVIIWLLVR